MDALLESPVAVGAIGLLIVTMAAIPYSQTRSRKATVGLGIAILVAIGGFVLERLYETPREQVHAAVGSLFDAIRADDLTAVLAHLDRSATEMRADAETLMPMFRVEAASEGGQVRVELPDDPRVEGAIAAAKLKPLIKVQHLKSGATGAYFDGLELDLVRRGDAWRVLAYRAAQDWRAGAARLRR